jgi:predicted CopG family antitoxin
MAVKTITVTEAAYRSLKAMKAQGESFSETILRMTKRKSLDEFYGVLTEKEGEELEKAIMDARRERTKLHAQRMERIMKEMGKSP